MKFNLPQNIRFVLNKLSENGHSAYIVGGCVRDLLCGKQPNDYDITTSALPHEIQNLFEKTIAIGIKHGTVTVLIDDETIEVTTFRTEAGYCDSRHPESVNFVNRVDDDLARRDFTVNALCYNDTEGLIDIFGGTNDIKNRVLRAVGDAKTRFSEDALRILRLFRFASTLSFNIENSTFDSALKCAPLLKNISAERIFTELKKASLGDNITVLSPLLQTGALDNYAIKNSDLARLNHLPIRENLRTFALLYLTSTNLQKTLDSLKCSNSFKNYCFKMAHLIKNVINSDKVSIKKALNYVDYDIVRDYLEYLKHIENANVSQQKILLSEILIANEPYKISHLDIVGNDITALGFDGKAVGEKLEFLLNEVINDPTLNKREKLLSLICN